jgi:hypothetical protein
MGRGTWVEIEDDVAWEARRRKRWEAYLEDQALAVLVDDHGDLGAVLAQLDQQDLHHVQLDQSLLVCINGEKDRLGLAEGPERGGS